PLHLLVPFSLFMSPSSTAFYSLSLHDALPIWFPLVRPISRVLTSASTSSAVLPSRFSTRAALPMLAVSARCSAISTLAKFRFRRSEEHTSELQSRENLVCRLLLEKKKTKNNQQ